MQISLRSHLTAGTAAVVAVGAVAMTPVAVTPVAGDALSLPSISVALAAFDSPLAQLFATADLANNYLFNASSNPAVSSNWAFAGFGTTFGVPPVNYPLLPSALADASLGGYSSVGLVSQIIDDALPIISQLGYNGLNYLNIIGNVVFTQGATLSQAVWTAAGQALAGNFPEALQTLRLAVLETVVNVTGLAGLLFQTVAARAAAVVATLVGTLPTALGVTVAQAQVVAARSVAVITDTFAALSSGDAEGAWNAAVGGLLGPSGIPGTLLNLSIGAGVQTGPIVTPDAAGITEVFVPSTRTLVQTFVKEITADLQTDPVPSVSPAAPVLPVLPAASELPASPAALKAGSSTASVRPAAVQVDPAVAAPAADRPASDSPAAVAGTGGTIASEAPAEKRATQRTARKAVGPRGD